MRTSTVTIKRLGKQPEKIKKTMSVDNNSIIPTSRSILRTASLPLKFELALAFWKTKDKLDVYSEIIQVNAYRSPNQLLNQNSVLRNIHKVVNYILCFKAF